jgi:nucleotide-binding universal stress UspA family protein
MTTTSLLPHLTGIVVAVDGSEPADRAATWAADLAHTEHRPLHLVHVIEPITAYYWGQLAPPLEALDAPLQKAAADGLTETAAALRASHPGLTVDAHVVVGNTRITLTELSERAHLMVTGTRGRGFLGKAHLGSTAMYLTRHTHCPLVVVRPEAERLGHRGVVAGIDDTERALPVLEVAFDFASTTGGPLTIVHSDWLLAPLTYRADYVPSPAIDEEEVRCLISEASAGLREKYPDVPVDVVVGHVAAEDELVGRSATRDLVVVGARSYGAVGEHVLGSVASRVAQQAVCPVAVIPRRPH